MKKKLLFIISLMLVAVMLMLTGCKSEFEGNYKEATAEQKAEIVAKLNSLETVEESKKSNMKLTGSSEIATGIESVQNKSSIKFSAIYDYSDENNARFYLKYEADVNGDYAGVNVKAKSTLEYTIDSLTKKAYVSVSMNSDGLGTILGSATGSVNINKKGYVDITSGEEDLDALFGSVGGIYDIDLPEIVEAFEDENVKVEVDNNKAKITMEEPGMKTTAYFIFVNEKEYKAKCDFHFENTYLTGDASVEMLPTSEKVSLPKDLDSYSEKIDLSTFLGSVLGID